MVLFTLQDVKFLDIITYPGLEIAEGGATFLCGESGSGKSTLLRLLNGTLSKAAGHIRYRDRDIEDCETIALRREVLLAGQSVYLFDKTIRENFEEYYAYRDLEPPDEETIRAYLDLCLAPFPLDSMCNLLSGGERQRAFLAILLSLEPKVLMLDEPTSALDDKTADGLMERILSHCREQKITLIVVSHDKTLAARYADHTITLEGGST